MINTLFFRWITPVLLIIDFYEKMAVSSKRREQMNKVQVSHIKQSLQRLHRCYTEIDLVRNTGIDNHVVRYSSNN